VARVLGLTAACLYLVAFAAAKVHPLWLAGVAWSCDGDQLLHQVVCTWLWAVA
jgi:hypothetical protein